MEESIRLAEAAATTGIKRSHALAGQTSQVIRAATSMRRRCVRLMRAVGVGCSASCAATSRGILVSIRRQNGVIRQVGCRVGGSVAAVATAITGMASAGPIGL